MTLNIAEQRESLRAELALATTWKVIAYQTADIIPPAVVIDNPAIDVQSGMVAQLIWPISIYYGRQSQQSISSAFDVALQEILIRLQKGAGIGFALGSATPRQDVTAMELPVYVITGTSPLGIC